MISPCVCKIAYKAGAVKRYTLSSIFFILCEISPNPPSDNVNRLEKFKVKGSALWKTEVQKEKNGWK